MLKKSAPCVVLLFTLLTACAVATPVSAEKSGVEGRVQVTPSCPGPQKIDQPACTSGLPGLVVKLLTPYGKTLKKTTTDQDGVFLLVVPPGSYVARIEVQGMYPRCPEQDVVVAKNQMTRVELTCDSGMR